VAAGVGLAVLVLVGVAFRPGGSSPGPPAGSAAVAAAVAAARVATIPASTFDAVGTNGALAVPERLHDQPDLVLRGLPEVFYDGADFCPYCAAERWALVAALSRFGTFSGLTSTSSGAHDVYPNTATFSFTGSRYTSRYVAFVGLEEYSNAIENGAYVRIARPSAAQSRLMATYETAPYAHGAGFPFVDVANRYLVPGGAVDPAVLAGHSFDAISRTLGDPASPIAHVVDGAANLFAAAICDATGRHPSDVCASPGVRSARARLAAERPLP